MKINFNKQWHLTSISGMDLIVDLPYDAMICEKREADCVNGINSGYFPGGRYRYEKTFDVSTEMLDRNISVHFEGVYRNCTVSVNGREVMKHNYGYSCFDADITEHVTAGSNTITVDVDNSLEPNCRWYSGSGIYRDVTMNIVDKDHISDIRIETLSLDPAVIRVIAHTVNDSVVRAEIRDKDEVIYDGPVGDITVENARLWSEKDPYLYDIRIYSDKDERTLKYGIRTLQWSAEQGLLINGVSVLLRGGCIHHDHGIIGANEYYDSEYRRISILKENGFNAVRMAHNQASSITLDICDELGMYVMNEAFDGWYIPKTYHDYSRQFYTDWKQDLKAMIVSSYNHPSVIMYSIGNEVSETAFEKGASMAGEMRAYVKTLDVTRPVTAGINVLLNVYSQMGMGIYKEKGEYKAMPLELKKGYKEKKTGSAFFNAMAQKLGKLMFFMSKGSKGDKACRDVAENLDILGLNYASSRYDEDVVKYSDRIMVGSETMVADLPYNWERVKKYPQLLGDFVWSGWDYLGEACIGDWTYSSYKGLPLLAGQGMIDITGKPLAAMYYMQIVWGLRKEPFIGLRPLNHADEEPHKGSWQFTNCIDSYSWDGYEGTKAVCEVYGNGDSIELLLNGNIIGRKKLKEFRTMFTFPYQSGELLARNLDEKGNVISESRLVSGNKETVINVSCDRKTLKAGSDELCYIMIEFTDTEGNLKPYVEKKLKIKVNGCLKLLGFGSALCKSDESYIDNVHNSYRGRALAIVKSTDQSGMGTVEVSCEGFETVVRSIEVTDNE